LNSEWYQLFSASLFGSHDKVDDFPMLIGVRNSELDEQYRSLSSSYQFDVLMKAARITRTGQNTDKNTVKRELEHLKKLFDKIETSRVGIRNHDEIPRTMGASFSL
jgi:hypothetical protein